MDNSTLFRNILSRPESATWADFSESEWRDLLQTAQTQGVAPVLYWALSKSGNFSSLPEKVRNELRAAYASTWFANQNILKELEVISTRFNAAGIPLVALKGSCFAVTIYPDIGLRPMSDLDVLVPRAKLAEAISIAASLGYVEDENEALPGLNDLLSYAASVEKAGRMPVVLEIHTSLIAEKSFRYAVPMKWFWEQTESLTGPTPGRFPGLLMLSPNAQVLFAAAHAMLRHGGGESPVRWFYDIDLLIRFYGERIEWDALLAQAQQFEWGSALAAALFQAESLFETPIPDVVRKNLEQLTDRNSVLVESLQTRSATHTLAELRSLRLLNGLSRWMQLWALIAPGPNYMRQRYGFKSNWALPGWYLFRWWGILIDAVRTLGILISKK